jgi:hypothetical protein
VPLAAWLWLVPLTPLLPVVDGLAKALGRRRRANPKEVTAS